MRFDNLFTHRLKSSVMCGCKPSVLGFQVDLEDQITNPDVLHPSSTTDASLRFQHLKLVSYVLLHRFCGLTYLKLSLPTTFQSNGIKESLYVEKVYEQKRKSHES